MPDTQSTAKDLTMRVVSDLPDDCTLDQIVRELLLHRMIEQGLADVSAGRVISHEQMLERVDSWISSGRDAPPIA